MNIIKKPLFLLVLSNLFLTAFVWFIYKNQDKMSILWANYDGPNYLVVTKCWYDKACIGKNFSLSLPLEYYPAHLPGYPALVWLADQFLNGPTAMLMTTLAGNILLTIYFYKLLNLYTDPKKAFLASVLFSIFPGRLFAARLVGAPESWFVASVLASIFYYKKDKNFLSALFLGLAQSLKTPAIILFAAYCIHSFINKKLSKIIVHCIIVMMVISGIFMLYKFQTGDFFAYFNSGDNHHLLPIPFQVFLSDQTWVQTIWLEEILYILALSFFGVYFLNRFFKLDIATIFTALFSLALIFVGHRDISRYASPIYPFLYLAFLPILSNKNTKIIFFLLLPAIVLYAINYINGNTAPIADWAPYL